MGPCSHRGLGQRPCERPQRPVGAPAARNRAAPRGRPQAPSALVPAGAAVRLTCRANLRRRCRWWVVYWQRLSSRPLPAQQRCSVQQKRVASQLRPAHQQKLCCQQRPDCLPQVSMHTEGRKQRHCPARWRQQLGWSRRSWMSSCRWKRPRQALRLVTLSHVTCFPKETRTAWIACGTGERPLHPSVMMTWAWPRSRIPCRIRRCWPLDLRLSWRDQCRLGGALRCLCVSALEARHRRPPHTRHSWEDSPLHCLSVSALEAPHRHPLLRAHGAWLWPAWPWPARCTPRYPNALAHGVQQMLARAPVQRRRPRRPACRRGAPARKRGIGSCASAPRAAPDVLGPGTALVRWRGLFRRAARPWTGSRPCRSALPAWRRSAAQGPAWPSSIGRADSRRSFAPGPEPSRAGRRAR